MTRIQSLGSGSGGRRAPQQPINQARLIDRRDRERHLDDARQPIRPDTRRSIRRAWLIGCWGERRQRCQ
jgi:hypothetical protein